MNTMKKITMLAPYICLLIFIAYILNNGLVQGHKNGNLLKHHKESLKTIKSDDGVIIDCVHIYSQPAFDHPMLKNHKIQMRPSSFPKGFEAINSTSAMVQRWHKFGQCPDRTVPIRRYTQTNNIFRKSAGLSEYAQVSQHSAIHGAYASFGVWDPKVEIGEYSAARVQIFPGEENDLNSIEAGWIVNQDVYFDKLPRTYAYWTSDNYKSTGCFNLDCPGFVQVSPVCETNSVIHPVSAYEGDKFGTSVKIYNEPEGNCWWLVLHDCLVGYWPNEIFNNNVNVNMASKVNWGGEVMNQNLAGHHTTTKMGSGHFPGEDLGKASHFDTIGYVDASGNCNDPVNVEVTMRPAYYTLQLTSQRSFSYGGPGYYEV